ncbi:3-ketoacyl-CoA synthase 20-like [Solanum tuberosum]|uniref:3-ketoacyl-CoA synthase n=1 Tax=Solanum tuberosum TaxID=4113 RepID=M1BSE5_SOLTU|nr:PREDICTED: 3-ketoacyl-CoA synthase 20-like [Solanum tuberosum]
MSISQPILEFPTIMWLIFLVLIFIWGLRINIIKKPSQKVFLIDFACYKPLASQMCTKEKSLEIAKSMGNYSEEMLDKMRMAMDKVGLGDSTYLPKTLVTNSPNLCLETSLKEAQDVMFGALDIVFEKTKIDPKDVGILIVNCSVFDPVPSLSCMIVNHYKMNENVLSYNLGGMGCTAGLLAVRLANQLLQVHESTYALILSTENTSHSCYFGNDQSKIIPNCTFRVGGAAILLSNHPSHRNSCKYELLHDVHCHGASSDRSYKSVFLEEDDHGLIGVSITKDLLVAATHAIETNLTSLAPFILPLSEKLLFLKNFIMRRKKYVPNFTKIDHFLPHVGGLPVLNQLQKKLGFSDLAMEASKISLRRFGNTSSSSIWYILAYAEAKGRIKKGDKIWQMAFGSGFKCSSVIWRTIRNVDTNDMKNPWKEESDVLIDLDLDINAPAHDYFQPHKST